MKTQSRISVLSFAFVFFFTAALAQTNPNLEQGFKAYGSYDDNAIDTISFTNFNLTVHIPLFSYPQRGNLTANYRLLYNGKVWKVNMDCVGQSCIPYWTLSNFRSSPFVFPQLDTNSVYATWSTVKYNNQNVVVFTAATSDGATHQLAGISTGGYETIDASGIYFNDPSGLYSNFVVLDRRGSGLRTASNTNWQDPNGNYVTGSGSGPVTDSLGRSLNTTYNDGTGTSGCSTASGLLPVGSASEYAFPGPNGGTRVVKLCYGVGGTLQTNFNAHDWDPLGNWDSIREYSGGFAPLQSVIVNDGTSWATSPQWTFQFNDADPGDPPGTNYGDLTQITLPTGGTITYTWGKASICGLTPVTPMSRVVTSRTINANDGTGNHTTTYGGLGGTSTDPAGNDTVHTITGLNGSCSYYETQTDYYKGTGSSRTLLKTVKTNYSWTTNPFDLYGDGTTTVANAVPTSVTTLWPNGSNYTESQVQTDYDGGFQFGNPTGSTTGTYGLVKEKREYDYGTNAPGPLLRKTNYTYAALTNSNYAAANLLDLVTQQTVYDGSSNKMAQTTSTYDGTPLQSSGVTTQHNTVSSTYKGNPTLVQKWLNTTGGSVTAKQTSYYDTGMPYQSTDLKGNNTTYTYGSTYVGAYVTQTQSPNTGSPAVSHIVKGTYDFDTGLLTSFTDQNNQISNYGYDPLGRMTSASLPDGGSVGVTYTDTVPVQIQKTVAVTSSLSKVTNTVFDGLGRVSQTQFHDPDCQVGSALVKGDYTYNFDTTQNTTYSTQSTPYCDTPGTLYGLSTRTDKDALGRTIKLTDTDGSIATTTFAQNTSTTTDEAGITRKTLTDGLGRLTKVWEDPTSLDYETDYGYNVLNNLLSVNQKGDNSSSRMRSFVYDSLARLTSATNPESGLISYTYSSSSGGCAGDPSVACTKIAPAPGQTGSSSVTTTYLYDALNRLTKKSYSDGTTPTASFGYDNDQSTLSCTTTTLPSLTDSYPFGTRTGMCDGSGATAWSHDKMGRVLIEKRAIVGSSAITNSSGYTYNLDGSNSTLTYPSGRTITYTPNSSGSYSAGRMASGVDSAHSINYVTIATYAPQGAIAGFANGSSITGIQTYNSRLQPLQLYYTNGTAAPLSQIQSSTCPTTAATIMSRLYNFGAGTNDNGDVYTVTDCLTTNRTQNFDYDHLNRLKDAYTTGSGTGVTNWGETYTIDPWGNLTNIALYPGKHNSEMLNAAPATNNQLNGFCYDAAGNLALNATCPVGTLFPTYFYNAENRLTSTAGWSYRYDGDGERVIKCNGTYPSCSAATLYWKGTGSDTLTETGWTGTQTEEYIFFNGQRVARRDGTGNTVDYYFADHLGSANVITGSGGGISKASVYYPFGGEISVTGSGFANNYKFTDKERDAESGLDFFGARHYSSAIGRFMVPDWATKPASVPYADFGNPQSLNLYGYVRNNPLTKFDPDGHDDIQQLLMQLAGSVAGFVVRHPDVGKTAEKVSNSLSLKGSVGVGVTTPPAFPVPIKGTATVYMKDGPDGLSAGLNGSVGSKGAEGDLDVPILKGDTLVNPITNMSLSPSGSADIGKGSISGSSDAEETSIGGTYGEGVVGGLDLGAATGALKDFVGAVGDGILTDVKQTVSDAVHSTGEPFSNDNSSGSSEDGK